MIDASALARLLPSQRWFGAKDRAIERVEVIDDATLDDGPPALVFCIAAVWLAGGGRQLYSLPLLVDGRGAPRDAFEDAGRLGVLGALMTQGETLKGDSGVFRFGGPGLDPRSPPGSVARRVGTEQTNTSVVLDEAIIVKLFRRVEAGPNPELELTRLLTSEGFENVAPHVGDVVYEGDLDGPGIEIDLGLAQRFITDGRDAWAETTSQLGALLDDVAPDEPDDEAVARAAAKNLDDLGRLGEVVASLHAVLAREELEPDVVAEPLTGADVNAWIQRVRAAFDALVGSGLDELQSARAGVEERLEAVTALEDVGKKTRVHGDLHLGQVLFTARGPIVLDFEGEPARALQERRAKQSPLLDVAGMLRSFDYAASAVLFERWEPGDGGWAASERRLRQWQSRARERFLHEYLRTAHEGGFLPADRNAQLTVLELFEIDKVLYEIGYELRHRPEWLRIPLRGLRQTLSRSGAR